MNPVITPEPAEKAEKKLTLKRAETEAAAILVRESSEQGCFSVLVGDNKCLSVLLGD